MTAPPVQWVEPRFRSARTALLKPATHITRPCRHAKDTDLAALVDAGKGDVPLVQMKWHCGNSGSRLPAGGPAHRRGRTWIRSASASVRARFPVPARLLRASSD